MGKHKKVGSEGTGRFIERDQAANTAEKSRTMSTEE